MKKYINAFMINDNTFLDKIKMTRRQEHIKTQGLKSL